MNEISNPNKGVYSRRTFLKFAGTGAAALALAACAVPAAPAAPSTAGAAGSAAPAAEAVKLAVMAFGQIDQPAYQALADAYMAQNSNVTMEAVFLPNDENYYAALQAQFAGGSNPDMASMQGWGFQIFADNGAIVGVNSLRERDGFDYAWADNQAIRDYTERGGDTYLIPMQVATMLMFYAKKLFDEAGVAYPTDDWTYDQFVETAQKLTKEVDGKKQWGYQANGNWFRDIHWIRGTGKQEFDSLIDPKTSAFAQPEIVDIVQQIASDFYHTLAISPKPADLDSGAGGINAGQSAMKYEGPWWFPQMVTEKMREEGTAIDFDVVLMPQQQDANRPHRGWAEGLVIFNTAPVDAAWESVKFMSGEEGQKIFSTVTGRIPNNVALVESFWAPMVQEQYGLTNTGAFLKAFDKGEIDIVSGLPRTQYWNEVIKPVGWDPLIAGTTTAADVMPQVDAGVQKLFDDFWASQG